MGKRGPRPTPTAELRLRDSWRAKTRKGEPEPDAKAPGCPSLLDAEAKREWNRVVPQLTKLGMLSTIDRAALAAYCQTWSDYVAAAQAVRVEGKTYTTTKGGLGKNPMVAIMNDARRDLLRFAQEFGLTPSARARVGSAAPVPAKKPDDKAKFFGAG